MLARSFERKHQLYLYPRMMPLGCSGGLQDINMLVLVILLVVIFTGELGTEIKTKMTSPVAAKL